MLLWTLARVRWKHHSCQQASQQCPSANSVRGIVSRFRSSRRFSFGASRPSLRRVFVHFLTCLKRIDLLTPKFQLFGPCLVMAPNLAGSQPWLFSFLVSSGWISVFNTDSPEDVPQGQLRFQRIRTRRAQPVTSPRGQLSGAACWSPTTCWTPFWRCPSEDAWQTGPVGERSQRRSRSLVGLGTSKRGEC